MTDVGGGGDEDGRRDTEAADVERFRAAGLLDDAAPVDRLELLRYLASQGVTVAEMVAAGDQLVSAAADRTLFGTGRLSTAGLAAAAGVSEERAAAIWQTAGLAPPGPDELPFSDGDVALVQAFEAAAAMFGDAAALQITRVIGSALARVADASASLFLTNVEGPLRRAGGSSADLAAANVTAAEMLLTVPLVMDRLFRHHAQVAIRRSRLARDEDMPYGSARTAVGFVDLVGFTERTQHLDADTLSSAVERFESRATFAAAGVGGRIVKSIGDEVMFTTLDAADACRVALELVEAVGADPVLGEARGAVGHGLVLARDGDVYGPVVNATARAVKVADPGAVLVTASVVQCAAGGAGIAFGEPRPVALRGFDEDLELIEVTRAP